MGFPGAIQVACRGMLNRVDGSGKQGSGASWRCDQVGLYGE